MNTPSTYSTLIVKHLLSDPDTAKTVSMWLAEEPDPEKRELRFADQLRNDFAEQYRLTAEGDEDAAFIQAVIAMAWERCSWRTVARALIRHYRVPVRLSQLTGSDIGGRLTQHIAAWRGPVN